MLARVFASAILSLCLCVPCFAQGTSGQSDVFIADDIGFLPVEESRALTAQAALGVRSATKIQPFRSPRQLAVYKTILNSSAILSSVPMTGADQETLNTHIDALLKRSSRVKPGSVEGAEGTLYSGVSVRMQGGIVLLELFIAISDWPDVMKLKEQGPIPAFVKSTIWLSVTRKKIEPRIEGDNGGVTYEAIQEDVLSLYKNAFENLLLAF